MLTTAPGWTFSTFTARVPVICLPPRSYTAADARTTREPDCSVTPGVGFWQPASTPSREHRAEPRRSPRS